jgi:Putative lipoprotein GNA1162-like
MRLQMFFVVSVSSLLIGCASNSYESRPFFQHEYAAESHGQKNILDRIVETDPGGFKVETSPQYLKDPPERIAVLPFADIGSANFVVDKVALTHRSKIERANWAWTDSQRLRRSLDGYLAQREFIVSPLDGVDAVLRARGIDTPAKLYQTPPEELGRLLGVDAIVYGTVTHYEAYYLLLVAGWQVSIEVSMVSTHGGENLVVAAGSRYAVQIMPALSVQDIVINSAENVLQLRDIILSRAEEETCREIVHRVPVSQELKARIEQRALDGAEEADPVSATSPTPLSESP